MLGVPITLYFNKQREFKAAIGGICSIILYSIMGYILVYLAIRVFEGKSIEISETVVESSNIFSNHSVHPSEGTKFKIAWILSLNAPGDYECIFENLDFKLMQYQSVLNENFQIDK